MASSFKPETAPEASPAGSPPSGQGIDRRTVDRHPSMLSMRYRMAGQTARWARTWSRNLSATGVAFAAVGLAEHVAQNTGVHAPRVEMELDLPGNGGPLCLLARIVWVRAGEEGADDEVGAHFMDITGYQAARIRDYVQRMLVP